MNGQTTAQTATLRNRNRPTIRLTLSETSAAESQGVRAPGVDLAAAHEWLDRLQQFGFAGATVEWIRELNESLQATLRDVLESWKDEYESALQGNGVSSPTAVPAFLKAFDAATPEQSDDASKLGAGARIAGHNITDNPYPPGTVLRAVWKLAFTSGTSQRSTANSILEGPNLVAPAPRKSPVDSDPDHNSILNVKETDSRVDREQRRFEYIEQLRIEIEESIERAREVRLKLKRLEAEAESERNTWQDVLSRAEEASEKLQLARAGIFPDAPRNRPDDRTESSPGSGLVFDSGHQSNPRIASRSVPNTLIDKGAEFDLSSLRRGKLQKIADCDPEWGLSARQIERLKDAVNGDTIGHLEKFQRETFNWEQAIPGFGESTITKLQDAHLAFRIQHDMPSPGEVLTTNETAVADVGPFGA